MAEFRMGTRRFLPYFNLIQNQTQFCQKTFDQTILRPKDVAQEFKSNFILNLHETFKIQNIKD